MRLFAPKKQRTSRAAALRPAPTMAGKIGDVLRDRDVLLRVLMVFLTLVALLIAVQSWKAPFPYRLREYVPNGILAEVAFERVNQFKTDIAMLERETRVPRVFVHDPEPLRRVPMLLREHLFEVADAGRLEELSAETRAAFGLTAPLTTATEPEGRRPAATPEQMFQTLLEVVTPPNGGLEQRVDEIVNDFDQVISPLRRTGVADPDQLAKLDVRPEDLITVVPRYREEDRQSIPAANVLLAEMLKGTGELGRRWKAYPLLERIQPLLERWLLKQPLQTVEFDEVETKREQTQARRETPAVTDVYKRGDVLVAPGQTINDEALEILWNQYEEAERRVPWWERVVRVATSFLLMLVLAVINGYYLIRNEPQLVWRTGRLAVYLATIIVAVALGRVLSFDPWRAEVIPILCTAMVLAIAYNQVLATLTGFSLALVLTLSIGAGLGQFVILLSAMATAVLPLSQVSSRSAVVKVGFWAALAYFTVTWGLGVVSAHSLDRIWTDNTLLVNSLRGAGWCLAAGYLVAGSLPFIESLFGVVTDISLLELSDVSHPLLQELVRRAPGTYNHSITVASIAETAADAIGANGLLCRVGAYFHDIGKMLKPQYFIENMMAGAESRHDHLAPAMSTLIIIGHVKDGVDLALQHNLPEPLVDFIEQHHGTTLVEYFYHEARKEAGSQPDHRHDAEESAFRYPGPKPQTREAGVLMIADAVEGASRTLVDPTPKRIESLVHEITMKRLLDGQFDDSPLTLNQIRTIEESLTKSLIAIYHGRIKYPEQRTA